jgi:MinD-like ATPase involved in chromosome partitioning or flagellar assembly
VTTIGMLGPSTRLGDLDVLRLWADVRWGVDSVPEVIARVTSDPVDVLVADASVAFLTDDVLKLSPQSVGRIYAIAESDGMHAWANALAGVTAVRSVHQITPADSSEESPPTSTGRVITVWGPVGSPGVTTAAISLATVCSLSGLTVVLCDLDTRGSSIAIALNLLDDTPGFAAACRLAGRGELTAEEVARLSAEVNQDGVRFSVLTGLPRASRWAEVAPPKSRAVIALLSTLFDVVIVDAGFGAEDNEWIEDAPQRDGATRALLQLADAVVAVGASDAVGVSRIIRGLDEIKDLCASPTLILNRVARGDARDATGVIHRFTEHRVSASIPADSRRGVEDALNRARLHPVPWRAIARTLGITVPAPQRPRWRR